MGGGILLETLCERGVIDKPQLPFNLLGTEFLEVHNFTFGGKQVEVVTDKALVVGISVDPGYDLEKQCRVCEDPVFGMDWVRGPAIVLKHEKSKYNIDFFPRPFSRVVRILVPEPGVDRPLILELEFEYGDDNRIATVYWYVASIFGGE